MASEPTGGGGDEVKEKQRFSEYKVYTRKVFKGSRKHPVINIGAEINAAIAAGHPVVPASKDPVISSDNDLTPPPFVPSSDSPSAHPAALASEELAAPPSDEPAAPTSDEPAAPASEEPAAPASEEPAAPASDESAAPAFDEIAGPAPEEPAPLSPDQPAAPATYQPDAPATYQPNAPATYQPAASAPDQPAAPVHDEPSAPAPDEHSASVPALAPSGSPPTVLAIPTLDDPAATTIFADPSNTVVSITDDKKNVERNCQGNNNITLTSINSDANDDYNSNKALQPVTEVANLTTLQPVARYGTVCDDSSRLDQVAGPRPQDLPSGNGPINMVVENQTKVNSTSRSKQDTRELQLKLGTELEIVRSWVKRIEEKQVQMSGYGSSLASKEGVDENAGGAKIARSEVASAGIPLEVSRPYHRLRLSVHNQGLGDSIEKEKRTPKANQFYRNSEFLLAKDKFPPAESNKKSKSNGKKLSGELGFGFVMGSKFFKSCSSLLEKLMKHKHSWVFNTPVDVEGLGLLDYFMIIKYPMDLGTVKMRLTKNWYKSPKEFAEDVRLTFRNAMTYNPKGQDVHVMAEQLSNIFEERWVIIESDYNREMRLGLDYGVALSTPTSRKAHPPRPPPLDVRRILDRSESMSYPVDSMLKSITLTPSNRTPAAPKKPKAKDPDKRDMTYEEKQKLSTKLQSLPLERLDAVVQIIKKRNSALFQNDEEIEVDIDSVDAETLWELDRFVTNYKKSLSKKKRKAELAIQASQARANSKHEVQGKTLAPAMSDAPKENKADQNAISSVSAFEGEKQADNRSRSSSSSSSSSDSDTSSSDSDSDSSSASESDTGSPRT